MTALLRIILAAAALSAAASSVQAIEFELAASDLGILVQAVPVPGDPGSLFLVSLDGQVTHMRPGSSEPRLVLSLNGVVTALEGEQGFFSLALHPDYLRTPRAFVAYTAQGTGNLELAEYSFDQPAAGGRVLLSVPMPEPLHHGGMVGFGPDGYLYLSVGNGFAALESLLQEPFVSQDLSTLYGKVLRLDVDAGQPYGIPADNPFIALPEARSEIWATGFRNPWKFAWSPTGELLVADVGQDRVEEVNLVSRAGNYGWPLREGSDCFRLGPLAPVVSEDCTSADLTDPIIEYFHDEAGGRAVSGGAFLDSGDYIFGDFVSGRVWLADPHTWEVTVLEAAPVAPWTGFVRAGDGEVYALAISGQLYRLASTGSP